jgi:hypothetical protein
MEIITYVVYLIADFILSCNLYIYWRNRGFTGINLDIRVFLAIFGISMIWIVIR